MHEGLSRLLRACARGPDGIYSASLPSSASDQAVERELRERVAAQQVDNYLASIAHHHSVPVMDYEVDRFLSRMCQGALILDIGGCWGWHWRRLAATRPDVGVVVIDFVRANLSHARRMLGLLAETQVALVHADATALPFPDAHTSFAGFEGIWTVQVFQHISDFARACREACRVLKRGGRFVNYSLHVTPLTRMAHRLMCKPFHAEGMLPNRFYLARANDSQRQIVAEVFAGEVTDRYTECLFHPDLRLTFPGRLGNPIGRIDARLGDFPGLGRWIARQRSFEVTRI